MICVARVKGFRNAANHLFFLFLQFLDDRLVKFREKILPCEYFGPFSAKNANTCIFHAVHEYIIQFTTASIGDVIQVQH